MKPKWSIRSIKRWQDGTYDALLIADQGNHQVYDRVFSTDGGFNWHSGRFAQRGPVDDEIQNELTSCVGSMVEYNITTVIF